MERVGVVIGYLLSVLSGHASARNCGNTVPAGPRSVWVTMTLASDAADKTWG
jgi:hypothetical protein